MAAYRASTRKIYQLKKRILILSDDELILSVLEELLIYEGYDVKTLHDAHTLIQAIQQFLPDVVLVNYLLDLNGETICHLIKSTPVTNKIPTIIISAYPRVPNTPESYDCDVFISKPFDIDFLLKTVDDCIQSRIST